MCCVRKRRAEYEKGKDEFPIRHEGLGDILFEGVEVDWTAVPEPDLNYSL